MAREFERFKEIKQIGAGAFGKTVLVEDLTEGQRLVVIKVPLNGETEKALITDLINNAVLQNSLREMAHPNIVKYLGFDKYENRFVMILEYVKGKDLRKIIGPMFQIRPPMDLTLALQVTKDICAGLVAAHKAHVFHSDIKPENILVRDDDGIAKLCDFGISQIMRSTSATAAGGTYPYMAPEALNGKASFQADIWSLSVTLYEMVTGTLPFPFPKDGNIFVFKATVDKADPTPPKKINPKVDERLNSLILRGLEKNLNVRFAKAQDMLNAIEAHLRGEDYTDIEIRSAREMIEEKKESEAETVLKNVVQRFPLKAEAYQLLGEIYTRWLKPAQCEGILRKGITQCPAHSALHLNLAMVLNGQKKRTEAITALEKAIQLGLGRQARYAETLLKAWRSYK